jgi:hypothetical protein
MKRLLLVLLLAGVCAPARAEWKDLKAGIDVQAVLAAVGTPLMVSKSRQGLQVTWTYDDGAYVLFENGRVRFWQPPVAKRKATSHCESQNAAKRSPTPSYLGERLTRVGVPIVQPTGATRCISTRARC